MDIIDIKRVIESKSVKLNADRLKNGDGKYMWVVSQGVFNKVREYCNLDKKAMDDFFDNAEYYVNFKWHDDVMKLWKEL